MSRRNSNAKSSSANAKTNPGMTWNSSRTSRWTALQKGLLTSGFFQASGCYSLPVFISSVRKLKGWALCIADHPFENRGRGSQSWLYWPRHRVGLWALGQETILSQPRQRNSRKNTDDTKHANPEMASLEQRSHDSVRRSLCSCLSFSYGERVGDSSWAWHWAVGTGKAAGWAWL